MRQYRLRLFFVLASVIIYVVAFVVLHRVLENSVDILATLPVVMAAWLLGLRGGLLAGLLAFPLNSLLVVLGVGGDWLLWVQHGGALGSGALVLVGAAVGSLKDLSVWVKRELAEHKQAEEALRESEEHSRAVVENVADAIAIIVGTEFVFVNKAFLTLHGLEDASQVLGRSKDEFVHPEDREWVNERALARQRGEDVPATYEYRILRRDGEVRTMQNSAVITTYKGRRASLGVSRDITESKRMEEELLESEERFRDLYENAPLAYFSVGIDGHIHMVNRGTEELLGYLRHSLIGRSVLELYADTPEGIGKARRLNQRIRAGEEIHGEELEMTRADGRSIWVNLTVHLIKDARGQPLERRAIVVDITESKRMEEELRKSAVEAARLSELEASRRRIIAAEERVRRTIAEELHGPVQTRMLLLSHRLETVRKRAPSAPEEVERELARVAAELDSLRENEIRRMSHRLHPSIIMVGLVAGLRSLRDHLEESIPIQLEIAQEVADLEGGGSSSIPEDVRLGLYRVAEEAMGNIIKHAGATQAAIRLWAGQGNTALVLSVADNGRGFDSDSSERSLGFTTMTDYLGALGGSLELESAPGSGARITVTIPLDHRRDGGPTVLDQTRLSLERLQDGAER